MSIGVLDKDGNPQTINTLNDLIAMVATAAAQATGNTTLAAVLTALGTNHTDEAALHADIATTLHGDLASILAKLTADPATNTTLAAAAASLATLVTGTKDNGPAWVSVWGVSGVPFHSADQHSAVANVTDVPTSGQHIVVDDIVVSVDTAMLVTLIEETTGTVMFGPWYMPANSGPIQLTTRGKKKLPTADKRLQVQTSVAGNITVQLGYHSEA